MKCVRIAIFCILIVLGANSALAEAKPKVVSFGPWTKVPFFIGPHDEKSIDIKIRSLLVDGKIKEFTTGDVHEITDRFIVVRIAYRVNDWLPDDEKPKEHRWKWQRGGWLLVDRNTARVSLVTLPEFD